MSRLHNESAGTRGYDFEAAKNDDSRIDGGLEALDELYTPINVNNTHSNFTRVVMVKKTIQPFDSQAENAENNKLLQAVENYIYDALTKNKEGERQDYNKWKQDWATTDESGGSPRQENWCNCGMFTLISMSLLRNGLRLRSNSYVQGLLYHRNLRRKLAWAIWKSDLGSNGVRWQPGTQRQATAATPIGGVTHK